MFRDIQQLPCESGPTKIPMRRNQPTEAVAVEQSPLLMSIKGSRAAANDLMRVPFLSKTFLKSKSLLLQTDRVGVYAESKYQGIGKRSGVMFPCVSCCQTSPLFLSHPTATRTLRETECHHH